MKVISIVLGVLLAFTATIYAQSNPVVLENSLLRYTISADGRNQEFLDRTTGIDYLNQGAHSYCARVRKDGQEYPATAVSREGDRLTIRFGQTGTEAVLGVESRNTYIRLTVESVSGGEIDSLVFLYAPLTLKGRPEEPFGACAFSLNLITRVDQLPALQTELGASCYRKFGMVGAQAAIVGTPMAGVLAALKEVLTEADQMPHCPVAGPWANEIPFNHGSYLFNFGTLTEATTEEWIEMAKSLGVSQIDNHGGSSAFFRFGDFVLNGDKWPDGWETYRKIVKRLHEAGIGSIFHTYSFFIDKQSKYVTPVPDRRLDAFRTFTLREAAGPDDTELPVNEPTKGMGTVTGFFEHNSVILHIGDELVTFAGATQEAPWKFTGVSRGALGTKAAAHEKDTAARQLKECFGLLVPDVESTLFEEIARNHAEVVNQCDFDGIYLDAIDGSSILRGADECWYWADKFVMEIQRHLKKPAGMEMSAMWHHFWQYRTRWQAWDYPRRGYKRFVDIHAETVNGGLLLPLHLGWWNFHSFNPPQIEPTYSDVVEYLGAKLIGWDAGISLTGAINKDSLSAVPLFRRAVDTLRTSEELRQAGTFDETVKAKLREPGKEFSLFSDETGKWCFRPAQYDGHTVAGAEPWSQAWNTTNPFAGQPVKLRIEALMSAPAYDHPENRVLADLSDSAMLTGKMRAAEGVTLQAEAAAADVPGPAGVLTAMNAGKVPQNAGWARLDWKYEPVLNLGNQQALGVWVEGDGRGEIIAVRLESPPHISFGAIADRYITVDFTGRRFFTLVETEAARWSDYVWNDGKWLYNSYRETIDFGAVQSLSLMYNNLPPNQEVRCTIGAVKALPMVACTLKNPVVTVNGQTISFPVEIPSGGYLEFYGGDTGTLYGPTGEMLGKVTPAEPAPSLQEGTNSLQFASDPTDPAPRARVVVISYGDPL